MTTTNMSHERFRVAHADWTDLHRAAGRGRSTVLRDLIRWYLRRPGAELPERPPRPDPDGCDTTCADSHLYEGGCLLSPMIIGVISPRTENDVTRYVWQCHMATICEGLFHVGYPDAPAARRAYDRHLTTDHPA